MPVVLPFCSVSHTIILHYFRQIQHLFPSTSYYLYLPHIHQHHHIIRQYEVHVDSSCAQCLPRCLDGRRLLLCDQGPQHPRRHPQLGQPELLLGHRRLDWLPMHRCQRYFCLYFVLQGQGTRCQLLDPSWDRMRAGDSCWRGVVSATGARQQSSRA